MGFLSTYPAFSRDMPLDLLDEQGGALLEGGTKLHVSAAAGRVLSACPFDGIRRQSGKPMNVSALKSMLGNPAIWQDFPHQFSSLVDVSGFSRIQALWKISDCGLCLAHVHPRNASGTLPMPYAAAYRFFRGIGTYALVSIFEQPEVDSALMSAFSEERELLVGSTEVCPASPSLMNRIASELDSSLQAAHGRPLATPLFPNADVLGATRFGELCLLFQMLLALLAVDELHRCFGRHVPTPIGAVFDIPMVTHAAVSSRSEETLRTFYSALRTFGKTIVFHEELWSDVERLIEKVSLRQSSQEELLVAALSINNDLLPPGSSSRASTSVVQSIVRAVINNSVGRHAASDKQEV
jgi:hypothetical protein